MDSKEIKAALKNARECIRNKEFKEALKLCKGVLEQSKNNYNALVFVGVAAEGLDQLDQSVKAYKRAIESSPEQVLAWQGLQGFYEKHPTPEYDEDLIRVYLKLAELYASDANKKNDVLKRLADLYSRRGDNEQAVQLYQDMIAQQDDKVKCAELQKCLVNSLVQQKSRTRPQEEMLVETVTTLLEIPDIDINNTETVFSVHISLLLKHDTAEVVEKQCKQIHLRFPQLLYPLEILILIGLDRIIDSDSGHLKFSDDLEFDEYANKLSTLTNDSPFLKVAQGVELLAKRNCIEARNLLQQAVGELPLTVCTIYCLAVSQLLLHTLADAETSCKTCLSLLQKKNRQLTIPSTRMTPLVQMLHARTLYNLGTTSALTTALQTLEKVSGLTKETQVLKGFIYLKLGDTDMAEECVASDNNSAESKALVGWICFHKQQTQEAADRLKEALNLDDKNSWISQMYSKALWEICKTMKTKESVESCFSRLLQTAKLDPYNSETFQYLGHFYLEIQKDEVKSKKCFQKAFDLDPNNDLAGSALCDLMSAQGEEDQAYKLLLSVTSKASAGCAKWAWLRLGLYQVKHDNPSVAVTSFQSALRADPADNHVWECLAEAYLHRGSYTAALKAFTKASELDPNSMYSFYKIASIKQTLCLYTEAIEEYKLILEKSSNYVPALKGLGETYLLLAKHHLLNFFNGRAKDNCQEAILHLTRAASHRPDLSCLWKLMGDACTLIHPLAKENFRFSVPEKLMKTADHGKEELCALDLLQTLQLGSRCYGKALKLLPECAALWHDLGVNYFHQSQNLSDQEKSLKEKSVQSLKKALALDPSNHKHWNALGVVACSKGAYDPALAQHCFIKSVQAESNNVVAWTNLATLYLKNDNIKLAHEAFKVAQSLEPSYVACWIGQALIAETIGDDDAMDLFRHTTELTTHIEGAVGYAHWVCSVLQDTSKHSTDIYHYSIKQMAAIPAASDALAKYLDRVKTNPTAYNMYGLLLEHQELYRSAFKAFESAVHILGRDAGQNICLRSVRINLARVLCKLGNFTEALVQYEELGDLDQFQDLCFVGLTFYKGGKYKESYQAYDKALQMAKTDDEKSHVYSALGMVAYKFGDNDGAKSVLFQSSQLSEPSVPGLEALCALGILQLDMTLTMAVLQELLSHKDKDMASMAQLMTISNCLLENNWSGAMSYVQQCIHKTPDNSSLWQLLAVLQLRQRHPARPTAAAVCARAAHVLQPNTQNILQLTAIGHLVDGTHLHKDTNNNAFRSAKMAVHLHPDKIENWCNLASAVHSRSVISNRTDIIYSLLKMEQTILMWILQQDIKDSLRAWCKKQLVITLLHLGQKENAKAHLEDIFANGDKTDKEFSIIMTCVLDGKSEELVNQMSQTSDPLYYLQIISKLQGDTDADIFMDILQKSGLSLSSKKDAEFISLLKAFYLYKDTLAGKNTDGKVQELNSILEDILKARPGNTMAILMKGCSSMDSNPRLAKHRMVDILESRKTRTEHGHDFSIARKCLLKILMSSKKEEEYIQTMLNEAEEDGDTELKQLHKQLCEK